MKNLFAAVIIAASFFRVTPAEAASFTFYFNMPAFTESGGAYSALTGKRSLLALMLDNGGADPFSETYAMSDIIGAQVVSVEGTSISGPVVATSFTNPFDDYAQTLITTDQFGLATLDVTKPNRGAAIASDPTNNGFARYQVAFTGPSNYRACTYAISIGDVRGAICGGGVPFTATGLLGDELELTAVVPLPLSGLMAVSAFGLLPILRLTRKKSARQSA